MCAGFFLVSTNTTLLALQLVAYGGVHISAAHFLSPYLTPVKLLWCTWPSPPSFPHFSLLPPLLLLPPSITSLHLSPLTVMSPTPPPPKALRGSAMAPCQRKLFMIGNQYPHIDKHTLWETVVVVVVVGGGGRNPELLEGTRGECIVTVREVHTHTCGGNMDWGTEKMFPGAVFSCLMCLCVCAGVQLCCHHGMRACVRACVCISKCIPLMPMLPCIP